MKLLVLCCLVGIVLSGTWEEMRNVDFDNTEFVKNAFNEWRDAFKREYQDVVQEVEAFRVFVSNWKMIVDHNKLYDAGESSFYMQLNQFGDLEGDNFLRYIHGHTGSCLKKRESEPESYYDPSLAFVNVPDSVDWTTKGVVTPVKNQGQCGSCWAFSTTGSIECRTAIKTGKLVSLSEQQLVDCSHAEGNLGCEGGLMDDAFKYVKKEGGLCTESEYPYTAKNGLCKASSCGTLYDDISGYVDVKTKSSSSLQAAAAEGCVSVAIEADQSSFQFYRGGILDGTCGTSLDHGVLVVGYGSDGGKEYWKVKNSWGASWGEDGYVRICRECNKNGNNGECGILDEPSYPTL